MRYKIKVYSIYEFGKRVDAKGNPHQEDSMFPLHGTASDADRLFILCDGMGGHEAGEVASATVCETMSRTILSHTAPEGTFTESDFDEGLAAAFDALDKKDTGAVKKMGTTMTFLKLHEGGCFIAHIGDSRVYHIRPGKTGKDTKIIYVTEDHSLVNDLVKIGEITPEQAKTDRRKNIITRAMQPNMERRPRSSKHSSSDIKAGDYFYLCSDGMLEVMDDIDLRNIFSANGVEDAVRVSRLTKATDGNRDNHSAIIVHILEVEGEAERDSAAPTVVPAASCIANDKEESAQVLSVEDDEETAGEKEAVEATSGAEEKKADKKTTSGVEEKETGKATTGAEEKKDEDKGGKTPDEASAPQKGKEVKFLRTVIIALLIILLLVIAGVCLKLRPGHGMRGEPERVEYAPGHGSPQ